MELSPIFNQHSAEKAGFNNSYKTLSGKNDNNDVDEADSYEIKDQKSAISGKENFHAEKKQTFSQFLVYKIAPGYKIISVSYEVDYSGMFYSGQI